MSLGKMITRTGNAWVVQRTKGRTRGRFCVVTKSEKPKRKAFRGANPSPYLFYGCFSNSAEGKRKALDRMRAVAGGRRKFRGGGKKKARRAARRAEPKKTRRARGGGILDVARRFRKRAGGGVFRGLGATKRRKRR